MSRTLRIAQYWVRTAGLPERVQALMLKYPQVPPKQIEDMATIDPTGEQGKYLEWIVRKTKDGNIRWPMHKNRVQRALQNYHEVKSKPSSWRELQADPDLFRSMSKYGLRDLEDLYEKRHGTQVGVEVAPSSGERVIYEDDTYKIIRVGGPGTDPEMAVEAACQYAQGTRWCTDKLKSAEGHLKAGPLYVIFKGGERFAQLHKETNQFMDDQDQPLTMGQDPGLVRILNKLGLISDLDYALQYAIYIKKGRYPEGEATIARSPKESIKYAIYALGRKPFPAGEPLIAKDSTLSLTYARDALQGRFPAGEPAIARDVNSSFHYARDVLQGRFPAGERLIAKDSNFSLAYARDVLKGPFPEGEPAIAMSPSSSLRYARDVFKGRFPDGEPAIASDSGSSFLYARDVLKGPFPEGEPKIAMNPYSSFSYALLALKGRFPAGEPAIATIGKISLDYAIRILKGRFPAGEPAIAGDLQHAREYYKLTGVRLDSPEFVS